MRKTEKKQVEQDRATEYFLRYARYGFSAREGDPFALYESIRGSVRSAREASAMLAVADTLRLLRYMERNETVSAVRAVYFAGRGRRLRRSEVSYRIRRFAADHYLDERTVYRRLSDAKHLLLHLLDVAEVYEGRAL